MGMPLSQDHVGDGIQRGMDKFVPKYRKEELGKLSSIACKCFVLVILVLIQLITKLQAGGSALLALTNGRS